MPTKQPSIAALANIRPHSSEAFAGMCDAARKLVDERLSYLATWSTPTLVPHSVKQRFIEHVAVLRMHIVYNEEALRSCWLDYLAGYQAGFTVQRCSICGCAVELNKLEAHNSACTPI